MLLEQTNNHSPLSSNPFDYRKYNRIAVHVGVDFLNLQRIVVGHGNSFSEFLEDLTTAIRCRVHSEEELFLLKMDFVFGDYLTNALGENVRPHAEALFDSVANKIKTELLQSQLYLAGRFDYSATKHSNYGLLFTKN